MSAYRGCPYCASRSFHTYSIYYESYRFKCNNCGGRFDNPSTYYSNDNNCPSCGSSNTAYYNNSDKHHYCYDCETRW